MRGRMMRDSDLLTAFMIYSRELCPGSATHVRAVCILGRVARRISATRTICNCWLALFGCGGLCAARDEPEAASQSLDEVRNGVVDRQ